MPARPLDIPEPLAARARSLGAVGEQWLDSLPDLLDDLASDWNVEIGPRLPGGFVGYLAEAVTADRRAAIVKIPVPDGLDGVAPFAGELRALRVGNRGSGYVELLAFDADRRAVLLERLGRPLGELGLPVEAQIDVVAETVPLGWIAVENDDAAELVAGDAMARLLRDFIHRHWERLGRPCSEAAVETALEYAARRETRFDRATAVLVHGDAHPHNVLEDPSRPGRFKLIDPQGLLADPAYDLAVALRGWNTELLAAADAAGATGQDELRRLAWAWHERLAAATGVDGQAIWEWSFVERVTSGLNLLQYGFDQEGAEYLAVATSLAGVR